MKIIIEPESGRKIKKEYNLTMREQFVGKRRWCECGALLEIEQTEDILMVVWNEYGMVTSCEIVCPLCHKHHRVALVGG
jgi:hypothetical protein